jgi:predicted enzyme related to lactoylglutathione lyase
LKPAITTITIGVEELERAFAFYRGLFNLPDDQIGAGEDHITFFFGELTLVLYPREMISQSLGKGPAVAGTPGFLLSHQASSAAEVDEILREVLVSGGVIVSEGADTEWGYSAYFEDTEGNVWELMAAPETVN